MESTQEQRAGHFQQLGFESGAEDSNVRSFDPSTSTAGEIIGTWSSCKGKFSGIDLQSYFAMEPESPIACRGRDELQALLSALDGEPTRRLGEAARVFRSGPLEASVAWELLGAPGESVPWRLAECRRRSRCRMSVRKAQLAASLAGGRRSPGASEPSTMRVRC